MKSCLFLFSILFYCSSSFSKPIKITDVSELDFGNGGPGDLSKQILPGTSETSTNGSFLITGDPNVSYSIVLPVTASMKTGSGPNTDTITISNFQSFPSGTGALGASGSQTLFIGATRAALRLNQKAGLYSGTFSITVVY